MRSKEALIVKKNVAEIFFPVCAKEKNCIIPIYMQVCSVSYILTFTVLCLASLWLIYVFVQAHRMAMFCTEILQIFIATLDIQ